MSDPHDRRLAATRDRAEDSRARCVLSGTRRGNPRVPTVTLHRPSEPARAVDPVAVFVRRHQVAAWRFLRVLGCRGLEAEAIAQDAFVLALQKGVDAHEDAAAAAFLRQTCKHLWLRTQRDDRRRAERHAAAAELSWQRDLASDDGAKIG